MRPYGSRAPIGMRPFAPGVGTRLRQPSPAQPSPARFGGAGRAPYGGNQFRLPNHGWSGQGDHDRDHHHRGIYWHGGVYPYGYPYGYGYGYGWPLFTGYVDPWLFGPDSFDYDNGYGSSAYGPPGYGYAPDAGYGSAGDYGDSLPSPYRDYGMPGYAPQGAGGQPQYPASAQPYAQPSYSQPAYTPPANAIAAVNNEAVTVIFKDGRPPEQVHNYLLTATTLTVLDPHYQQIPLADVNLEATQAANRATGIDFRVPPAGQ